MREEVLCFANVFREDGGGEPLRDTVVKGQGLLNLRNRFLR